LNGTLPLLFVFLSAAALLALWFSFRKWKSTEKDWCVLMYFVGTAPGGLDPRLDVKLQQCLDALDLLPCNDSMKESAHPHWARVHVVYRAIWNDPTKAPTGGVIHWRLFAPKVPALGASVVGDLEQDLHAFYSWAFATCPAKRYAVYFWGHSFGPGGLFEVGRPIIVDAPPSPIVWTGLTITAAKTSLKTIVSRRALALERVRSLTPTNPSEPGPPPPPPFQPKVEIVLFQDCWMSTLETMYALQDTVRYVVASQSLVPIGYDKVTEQPNPLATWPYEAIINALLTQPSYADEALKELRNYFSTSDIQRFPNPTVPFALLDLGEEPDLVSTRLTSPFRQLVSALEPLGKAGRGQLIEAQDAVAGRLYKYVVDKGQLVMRAGDIALIDVVTLCEHLDTAGAYSGVPFPPGQDALIRSAARKVKEALVGDGVTAPVIKDKFEAFDPGGELKFTGVSVLYKGTFWPAGATLMYLVSWNFYRTLEFATAATASVPSTCWTVYAFEHSPFSSPTCT
jgi:hypothetical protein